MRGLNLYSRVQAWLGLDLVNARLVLLNGAAENQVRQNGLVLQELEANREQVREMRAAIESNANDAAARHLVWLESSKETDHAIFETKASVDRLVELVTPRAERLQGRRPVGGWDEVVTQNLQQFEEQART
jgi:hypothetical protein